MIDSYGLCVQADGSNGDSAHRSGLASALESLVGEEDLALFWGRKIKTHLEVSPGIYRRSPYGDTWDTHPRCFSRDQASRVILAYALLGWKKEIRTWLRQMLKRGLFHQNNMHDLTLKWKMPDIMGLGEWSNVIRGLDWWWAYPLLILLDINFIFMVFLRDSWDGASLYVPDLKYAQIKYPTPTAWLANSWNNKTKWLEEALHNHSLAMNGCIELQPLFISLNSFHGASKRDMTNS